MIRSFVQANIANSRWVDGIFPEVWRTDGNGYFVGNVVPLELAPNSLVYDLGAGSRPSISVEEKRRLGIRVIGVDISAKELQGAPSGAYDETIEADLCTAVGPGDGDLILCQATLEHVVDTVGAIRGLASFARPGGRVAIFVPCRNAPFAVINRLLPESWKRRLLFSLFPDKATGHDGFPAHYDHCTPAGLRELGELNDLHIVWQRSFWTSSYFYIFVPAYVAWRLSQLLHRALRRDEACETFALVWRKGT